MCRLFCRLSFSGCVGEASSTNDSKFLPPGQPPRFTVTHFAFFLVSTGMLFIPDLWLMAHRTATLVWWVRWPMFLVSFRSSNLRHSLWAKLNYVPHRDVPQLQHKSVSFIFDCSRYWRNSNVGRCMDESDHRSRKMCRWSFSPGRFFNWTHNISSE